MQGVGTWEHDSHGRMSLELCNRTWCGLRGNCCPNESQWIPAWRGARSCYSAVFRGMWCSPCMRGDPTSGFHCVGNDTVELSSEAGAFASFFLTIVSSVQKEHLQVYRRVGIICWELSSSGTWVQGIRGQRTAGGLGQCCWASMHLTGIQLENYCRCLKCSFQSDSVAYYNPVSLRSSCCLPFCLGLAKRNHRTCFQFCMKNVRAQS